MRERVGGEGGVDGGRPDEKHCSMSHALTRSSANGVTRWHLGKRGLVSEGNANTGEGSVYDGVLMRAAPDVNVSRSEQKAGLSAVECRAWRMGLVQCFRGRRAARKAHI